MKSIVARCLALLCAALPAVDACAQAMTASDEVRLQLRLGPDGRLRLIPEGAAQMPPSLLQPPLPTLTAAERAIDLPANGTGIVLRVSSAESDNGVCPGYQTVRIGPFAGCDVFVFQGLPGATGSTDLTFEYDTGLGFGFDASFGLGWVDAAQSDLSPMGWLLLPGVGDTNRLPGLIGLDARNLRQQFASYGVGSFIRLSPEFRLDFGYGHTNGPGSSFDLLALPGLPTEQDSLFIGLSYGRFSGGLIGRQTRIGPDGTSTDSLDLGFAWRMPWNAELEFGARNLITRPPKPDPGTQPLDEGDLRVPYLRYHQEL